MRSQHYTEHSQAYNYCFTLTRNHYAKTTKTTTDREKIYTLLGLLYEHQARKLQNK